MDKDEEGGSCTVFVGGKKVVLHGSDCGGAIDKGEIQVDVDGGAILVGGVKVGICNKKK